MTLNTEALDLPFCDLCTASIPLGDLEQGKAVRHLGKTIGACCLGALVKPVAETAALASRPSGSEGRLLPLALAMLTAVAAATIFLDFRLTTLDERYGKEVEGLRDSIRSQADVLQKLAVDQDAVARKSDTDQVQERLAQTDAGMGKLGEQFQAGLDAQQKQMAAMGQRIVDSERQRPDYAPALQDLRQQMQQLGISLAELRAAPRAPQGDALPPGPPQFGGDPAMAGGGAVSPSGGQPNGAQPAGGSALPPALASLAQKLKDEDAGTRFEALDKLLASKNAQVVPFVLPLTKDADTFVRRLAVEGLKDHKLVAVVDALLVALLDPVPLIADTAWRSLKDLTGQKLPFDSAAKREDRAKAQQAWQDWWTKHKDQFGG